LIVGGSGAEQLADLLENKDAVLAFGSPQNVKALFEARVARGIVS
jgi:hypothetical protein